MTYLASIISFSSMYIPSIIRRQDSNPQPLGCKSSSYTTRQTMAPRHKLIFIKFIYLKNESELFVIFCVNSFFFFCVNAICILWFSTVNQRLRVSDGHIALFRFRLLSNFSHFESLQKYWKTRVNNAIVFGPFFSYSCFSFHSNEVVLRDSKSQHFATGRRFNI